MKIVFRVLNNTTDLAITIFDDSTMIAIDKVGTVPAKQFIRYALHVSSYYVKLTFCWFLQSEIRDNMTISRVNKAKDDPYH